MPKIKSAIKKMHQSEARGIANRKVKNRTKTLLDDFKKTPTQKAYSELVSALDKEAKTNIIHKNKAARLKSRLAKYLPTKKVASKATSKS